MWLTPQDVDRLSSAAHGVADGQRGVEQEPADAVVELDEGPEGHHRDRRRRQQPRHPSAGGADAAVSARW
jgi:hypothetical protein